ncbi:MAG TPA: MFS transporter [Streptosporangiaceae bacterium]|nr:MFS transporter [Streptosporangiaceae bacterium]
MAETERANSQAGRGNAYLRLLRVPGARGFVAAGLIGRMPMSMLGLGIVLLVSAMTGRYGTAGAVAATGAICYAVLVPRLGRLTDRFGQARVLRPLTGVFAVSAVAFVACALLRAPLWTLFVTGGALGGTMPSLGSMVRARWSYLAAAAGDTQMLHTAFSLESVADELIFITGPAIVAILATEVHPVAGVVAAAVLTVAGTLWLAAQRRTEPPPQPSRQRSGGAIRLPGMVALATVYVFLGAMFGTVDLSTIAFAAQQGHKPLAGLVLGTYALGSAVGGLWYGARQWRAPLARRFLITLAGIVLGVAPLWALPNLPIMFAVIFFSGLSIAPTLIAGFSLIERRVPPQLMTEGMSWLSTSIGIGLALGPPVAGRVIDARGAHWGYALALGWGILAAVCGLLGARALRVPPQVAAAASMITPADAGHEADSDKVPSWQAAPPSGGTGQATSRPTHAPPPPQEARRRSRQPFGMRRKNT